jgi:hypothetical protein
LLIFSIDLLHLLILLLLLLLLPQPLLLVRAILREINDFKLKLYVILALLMLKFVSNLV